MKENIKRNDLKTNFLKQSIIRIDYDYLFEGNLEKIVEKMYPILNKNGYKMDSNLEERESLKEEFSSFTNIQKDIKIDITRKFTVFTINYHQYENFEKINEIFDKLIDILKNIRKGFSINRVGERKKNYYILKDITKINDYFEEKIISLNELIKKDNLVLKDNMECFMYQQYKVNQKITVSNGVLINEKNEQEEVYQITLDIDIYNDNIEENQINLLEINECIFNIYISALKEEFLLNLKEKEYEDGVIFKI